jgi:hypothetical protein
MCIVIGAMLGMGRDAVVWEGIFKGQPAAIKLVILTLAADSDEAAASLQQEVRAYAALEGLQGTISNMCELPATSLVRDSHYNGDVSFIGTAIPQCLGVGSFDDGEGDVHQCIALERYTMPRSWHSCISCRV